MAPTYCTINENSMHFLYQPRSLVDKCKSKSDRLCLLFHFIFSSVILSSQRWLLIGSNWHLFVIAPSGSRWLLLIVATEFLRLILYLSVCSAVKGLKPAGLCNCMAAAHFSNASPCFNNPPPVLHPITVQQITLRQALTGNLILETLLQCGKWRPWWRIPWERGFQKY